jgi:hypothetical protein
MRIFSNPTDLYSCRPLPGKGIAKLTPKFLTYVNLVTQVSYVHIVPIVIDNTPYLELHQMTCQAKNISGIRIRPDRGWRHGMILCRGA